MWRSFKDKYAIIGREITASLALSAIAGAFSILLAGPAIGALTALLAFAMMLIAFIDLRLYVIPDALSLPAIPLGILASSILTSADTALAAAQNSTIAALVGAAFLFLIRQAYLHYRGIEGLGLGDVKLAGAAGAWVGLEWLAATCLLATCAALLAVLIRRRTGQPEDTTLQTAVPFGSFIAPSIVLVWLWRIAVT
jgi:leader peptidase (prepilin peptidase) / N-methyltransferase